MRPAAAVVVGSIILYLLYTKKAVNTWKAITS